MKLPFLPIGLQLLAVATMIDSLVVFSIFSRHCRRRHFTSSTSLFAKKKASRVGDFWEAKMDVWRPDISDVERISYGKPAKKKGTGSRGVPHRLNLDDRNRGFLEIIGSGWRSQRKEAPLLNSYRSLCDARGQASIILHKGNTGVDEIVCDLSPLRNPKIFHEVAQKCLELQQGGEVVFQAASGSDIIGNNDGTEDLSMTLSIVDGGIIENSENFDAGPW
eukprot:CAMPEP_0170898432 /NCGR_PEP_ID=MMETSP0734-20130129/46063_1 /TAXON_ID=186038 /ORGANISM="Fragilariopsis kerguelensis, Strain L26-C5" /LENGTH=219 /DNA_ID=CAMNT_0011291217 /DNA_START=99 /DNA_END=755 /DNA_ORIENTATION=+